MAVSKKKEVNSKKAKKDEDSKKLSSFGKLLLNSWQEYKSNFKTYLWLVTLLVFIPSLIITLLTALYFPSFFQIQETPEQVFQLFSSSAFIVFFSLVFIINLLLTFFLISSLGYISVYNTKSSLKESFSGGKKFFLKVLGLNLILIISMLFLFSAFIIPGIIFLVFWIFSLYFLFEDKKEKKILKSMGKSLRLVRGKWWRTFGFIVLFSLILLLINLAIGSIKQILGMLIFSSFASGEQISFFIRVLLSAFSSVFDSIFVLIILPLGILFFKNLYKDMKKKRS